jgi:hypothetical protein
MHTPSGNGNVKLESAEIGRWQRTDFPYCNRDEHNAQGQHDGERTKFSSASQDLTAYYSLTESGFDRNLQRRK